MRAVLNRLWIEDTGAVVSAEIMLIGTILVIGMIVGLKSVRDSVTTELADVAAAFDSVYSGYGSGWNNGGWNNGGWNNGGWDSGWSGDSGAAGISTAAGTGWES